MSSANKSTLFIVFLTVFIDLLGFGIVLPLLPRYGTYFSASESMLGLLMASFSAMQFVFAPIWGGVSDRIGRRPILLLGLFGSTVSYAMFGVASSLGRDGILIGLSPLAWLFITRIAAGISGATISTAQAVIADSTGVENRGRGMALIGAAFGMGFTFGPMIGAACTWSDMASVGLSNKQYREVLSWEARSELIDLPTFVREMRDKDIFRGADERAAAILLEKPVPRQQLRSVLMQPPSALPGYVASAMSAIAFCLALVRLKETRPQEGPIASAHGKRSLLNLTSVLRGSSSGPLLMILVSVFVTTFGFAQFESTLSLLTREFGYGSRSNFLLFAYVGFVLSLGQGMLVRRFLPRIGEYRMALAGVVMMAAGFCLTGLTGLKVLPPGSLWAILPVIVIGFSAVTPSLQSLLSQAATRDEQGSILGAGQSLSSLARILGPFLGVQLLAISTATPYFLGAGLIVLSGLLIRMIPRTPAKNAA
ncbi:MAG: MFS transporter [Planctomyces sp.]|nr:MFS transporter [Planctomyces sp.]